MNKSVNSPIIYDFHSKSLRDSIFARRNQSSDHNFKGIPAVVVGVQDYESIQCLDVKASINDIYVERDNLVLESITLKKVFVSLSNSGGFRVKQPVQVGDNVRLSWSHRDLGDYLDGDGSPVDININEIAQIEDCWITLDGGTRKNHTNPSLTDMIIESDDTEIRITPTGNVTVNTSGTSYIKSSHHTVDTDMTITGNTSINGTLTVDGATTLKSTTESQGALTALAGTFSSTYAGVAGASATFNVDMNVTGTVTIDGININTHTHVSPNGGGTTSPPS